MPLSKHRLQEMWKSGYCEALVRIVAGSGADSNAARVHLLKHHLLETQCHDCTQATQMKNVEMAVASAMGPDAVQVFLGGGDITQMPGYDIKILEPILAPLLTPTMSRWLVAAAKRPPLDLSDTEDTSGN